MYSRQGSSFNCHSEVERGVNSNVLTASKNTSTCSDNRTSSSNKHLEKHSAGKRVISSNSKRTHSGRSASTTSTQATSIDFPEEVPAATGFVDIDLLGISAWIHPQPNENSAAHQQPGMSNTFVDNISNLYCPYHEAIPQTQYLGLPNGYGSNLTPIDHWKNQAESAEGAVLVHLGGRQVHGCTCIVLQDDHVLQ